VDQPSGGNERFVAVSGYAEDAEGRVLLVRTRARPDTWELPGGRIEAGETLDEAVRREYREETGLAFRPLGLTGVYGNVLQRLIVVVFRGTVQAGAVRVPEDEIAEARFVAHGADLERLVTRPQMRSRILDARAATSLAPYENWQLVGRARRTVRMPDSPD